MALKKSNPTKTFAWKELREHLNEINQFHLKQLFRENADRKEIFSVVLDDLKIDYSKNLITQKTINLLIKLANEMDLTDAIEKYFSGDKINATENTAVLHTALRSNSREPLLIDGKDIRPKVKSTLKKVRAFSNKVISGKWKGYTGKAITDVVNIGIGGSYLGPYMVTEALKFYKNKLNVHFVSNIDGDHVTEKLQNLNTETTLFIVVSKSFGSVETITNANTIKNWFLQSATLFDIPKHFIAVTSKEILAVNFGIDKKNIFPMWDWVGGRFSLWSAVGLSISLSIGFDNFKEFLNGAEEIDIHFKEAPFDKNLPVLLALIGIWYNNFYNTETEAILSFTEYLNKFPYYLQQVAMESNGKEMDRNGNKVTYQTGGVVWGNTGTNMQHAFIQLIHQGTKLIPCDFIGYKKSLHGLKDHHKELMANYYAQIDALAYGKTKDEVHLELKTNRKSHDIEKLLPFKVFEGNKPSTMILFDKLTPKSLGKLIAVYEHKIFTQGVLWNIYSFDQFGVELGKALVKNFR